LPLRKRAKYRAAIYLPKLGDDPRCELLGLFLGDIAWAALQRFVAQGMK
jgi:hypothetical protein